MGKIASMHYYSARRVQVFLVWFFSVFFVFNRDLLCDVFTQESEE